MSKERCAGAEHGSESTDADSRKRSGARSAGEAQDAKGASNVKRLAAKLRAAREIYEGVFFAPYGRAIQREYLTQRDAFLLLSFSDLLGIPNPVHFYTLELYPELLEQFHEWHLRMGMPNAPEEGWRCC